MQQHMLHVRGPSFPLSRDTGVGATALTPRTQSSLAREVGRSATPNTDHGSEALLLPCVCVWLLELGMRATVRPRSTPVKTRDDSWAEHQASSASRQQTVDRPSSLRHEWRLLCGFHGVFRHSRLGGSDGMLFHSLRTGLML